MGAGTNAAGTGADGAARSRRAAARGATEPAAAPEEGEGKPGTGDTGDTGNAGDAGNAGNAGNAGGATPSGSSTEPPSASTPHTTPAESADPPDPADSTGPSDPADAASADGDASEPSEPGSRFSLTQDTARPEGGGRAAPRDAPAPARQWPLLSVLGTVGLGLLIVGLHPFAEAFRVGTILIGFALIGGAVLRRVMPSVGMLAVRSRFTDMLTYGLLGVAIVMLSLMTQPRPWLEIPFLEDIVHSTVP
ncbi:DUF3017 domain-containing protein [Streptomyces corynorhini]|uniref:DUF3017 domain-containing protein n=1 Tax=Streptomyces corynorhini TaxID=2282652 RepID=A0A370B1W2_9ACTN|nr:DUF3017 domain-containing protein [Streptomyces corynorhini]RDG35808.1 DUF3017 domain-containing protein [Streptomyces corynorhini]